MSADVSMDMWSLWGEMWTNRALSGADNPSTQGAKNIVSLANKGLPFSTATQILDVGCGTGDLASRIVPYSPPGKIIASDLSPGMLKQASARGAKEGWKNVEFKILDATKMTDIEDGSCSHVLSAFAMYFLPPTATAEALRVLQPGGVLVSSYMVKTAWMDILHPLSVIRPDRQIPSGYEAFAAPGLIQKSFEDAGFKDYEQVKIPVSIKYEDAEELVDFSIESMPFLNGMTGDLTKEERDRWRSLVVEKVKMEYPDGVLTGRAIIAMGRK